MVVRVAMASTTKAACPTHVSVAVTHTHTPIHWCFEVVTENMFLFLNYYTRSFFNIEKLWILPWSETLNDDYLHTYSNGTGTVHKTPNDKNKTQPSF